MKRTLTQQDYVETSTLFRRGRAFYVQLLDSPSHSAYISPGHVGNSGYTSYSIRSVFPVLYGDQTHLFVVSGHVTCDLRYFVTLR